MMFSDDESPKTCLDGDSRLLFEVRSKINRPDGEAVGMTDLIMKSEAEKSMPFQLFISEHT
eukprot:11870001-Ditylum_brightwellii.AAC.1